jgi:CHAD domain-containing protein
LAEQMESIPARTQDALEQHRLRILAKRLRYNVESLRPLLPAKRAERWYRRATDCQTRIGMERDLVQALGIAEQLQVPEGIVEFLRGVRFSDKRLRPRP